jgi:hypothetical protein
MNRLEMPVNLSLMDMSESSMKNLMPIKVLDTYDGGTGNFHQDGLFSTEIFGRVGSQERDNRFAKIDVKIPILHPFIYKKIVRLRSIYGDIIAGRQYAIFDPVTKDLEPSDMISGQTGYAFFLNHLPKIEFKLTGSAKREESVKTVTNALESGRAFCRLIPVIPAGLRDAYIGADGRTNEDEINGRYRSLLASANAIPDNADSTSGAFNTTRLTMQNAFNAIFEYLWNLYEGKRGFAYKRYYSRGVFNGTRNVISAMDTSVRHLGDKNAPKLNSTVVGLYQTLKALLPVAQHLILNGYLKDAFEAGDGRAYTTNPKTLKREVVNVPRKEFDRFNTPEGIEKIISNFFDRSVRGAPVTIAGNYLGLVYRGQKNGKNVFRFFNDIDELPTELPRRDVHPITFAELLYVSGYREWNKYPMTSTRYPVAGLGSIYVSYFYVKTTTQGVARWELDEEWNLKKFFDNNPIDHAYEYPDFDVGTYVETASPNPSRLAGLGGDFDGDTMSQIGLYMDESIRKVNDYLSKANSYLNPKGSFLNSPRVETVERVIVGLMWRK